MRSNQCWWPVALSSELEPTKPLGIFVDGESIVLFRDQQGAAKALENRCPHRRAPLSLGTVRSEGWLQCGYHGWSFDGSTGQCRAIPNLPDETQVPRGYGVYSYSTVEQNGFIYVARSDTEEAPPPANSVITEQTFSGRTMVGLSDQEIIAGLIDKPSLFLTAPCFRIADTLISDLQLKDDQWQIERAAYWVGQPSFDGLVKEYPLVFRLAICNGRNELELSFSSMEKGVLASAHWAITPSARGVSALLWHCVVHSSANGFSDQLLRTASSLLRGVIKPKQHIDPVALSQLMEGPSVAWPRREVPVTLYGDSLIQERARL